MKFKENALSILFQKGTVDYCLGLFNNITQYVERFFKLFNTQKSKPH